MAHWTIISKFIMGMALIMILSGFDFSRHSIPLEEINPGGPPKDGIPALLYPRFIQVNEARFLKDENRLLAIVQGEGARAYPIRILNWHEVVNDTINGKPILVTYCPLCGTGIAFDPVINGKKYTFGVSGLLHNSDLLMYDHQTESLWSQITAEAVTGPMTGTRLRPIFMIHTTWGEWRQKHPDTQVLSTDTGYLRDYSRDPYSGYAETRSILFPVKNRNDKYHPKEWVIGIVINGQAKAYPYLELAKHPPVFSDTVNGQKIQIHYNDKSKTAFITDEKGMPLPSVVAFWFAWYAFYPHTLVFSTETSP